MANPFAKDTHERDTVHGKNPQFLIERITRLKIYETQYWKVGCFGLTEASLVDEAVKLKAVGGTYGGTKKPTNFLVLLLKMLQMFVDLPIVLEFVRNKDHKYVRLLGAAYVRLTCTPTEVYEHLEPLYSDYRKVRYMNSMGKYEITHVDCVIEDLLTKSIVFDITLPHLTPRHLLEESKSLKPRESLVDVSSSAAAAPNVHGNEAPPPCTSLPPLPTPLPRPNKRRRSRSP